MSEPPYTCATINLAKDSINDILREIDKHPERVDFSRIEQFAKWANEALEEIREANSQLRAWGQEMQCDLERNRNEPS